MNTTTSKTIDSIKVGHRFRKDLGTIDLATELADRESRLRAVEHQVGVYHEARPPARELAIEVLHGHLQALCPYLPSATEASAQRAAEAPLRARDE